MVLNVYRYLVCVPHICIRNTRMKGSIRPQLGHLFLGNTINDAFHHYFPFLCQLLTGVLDPALGQFCSLLEAPVEPTLQRSDYFVVGISTTMLGVDTSKTWMTKTWGSKT